MTVRYVGPGGNNANDGLSWANRKLTLNGVEDTPVVAGDTVYVGPGVYRELLTVDVSGAAGSPITYIGDVTGEHTDGVGGIVRITGSNNDQAAARANGITSTTKIYRTFRGLSFDTCTNYQISLSTNCTNVTIEDCYFGYGLYGIIVSGETQAAITVRRCIFGGAHYAINFTHTSVSNSTGHLVEGCVLSSRANASCISTSRVGGITVKNCTFLGGGNGVYIVAALDMGQTITVNNNVFAGCTTYALRAVTLGEIVENYNSFYANDGDRFNVATGANSNTYPPLFNPPVLLDGFRFPWHFGELSKWSALARIAGTGEATDDLFGITRPATSSKKSWGAIQATGAARETTTIDGASGASIKLPDAGEQFLMRVPVTNASTVFTVKCYREADYAGTNPTLIVRQAGQADNTFTDVGAAGAWNTLTVTCTPAADPEWVDLFVVSYNTAVAGNYDCFFDTVTVT